MRVLLVTPEDPANHRSGAGLIVRESLAALKRQRGYQSFVVVVADPRTTAFPTSGARPDTEFIARPEMGRGTLARTIMHSGLTSAERSVVEVTRVRSRDVDLVIWFGSTWDPVTAYLPAASHAPIVHHPNDSITLFEYRRARTVVRPVRLALARRQERRALEAGYAATVFVSDVDATVARELAPRATIVSVPLGVDLDMFRPRPESDGPPPLTALFTGVMAYGPNRDAATYLLDEILPLLPSALRVRLVGRDPSSTLLRRGADDARIDITGEVADISAEYRNAAIFTAPIVSGSGFRNKLLEAMASGLPIVTTSLAVESFGRVPPGVLVGDDPHAFADHVTTLVNDPARRHALGNAARAFVERGWAWEQRTERLLAALAGG